MYKKSYASNEQLEIETIKNSTIYNSTSKHEILNYFQDVDYPHAENYKSGLKKIKRDLNKKRQLLSL